MLLIWVMVLHGAFGLQQQTPQAPRDRVVGEVARFFRGGRTLVNGFVRVPHRLLTGVTGVGGDGVYSVEIQVTDQGGTVLTRDSWTRRVPWAARKVAGSESVEPFAFALAPGTYNVAVVVRDSASGARETVDLPVTAFAARPHASDLLLAFAIRQGSASDSLPGPSEVRKGNLFIASAPDLTLPLDRPVLSYYCEVYRDSAGSVPWVVKVVAADGHAIVSAPAVQATVGAGGGPIAASIDLAGLPPGSYTLALATGAGPDTATSAAAFRVGGFETARDVAQASAESADRFTDATEAQLDSMFEPLIYLAEQGELSVYHGLTVEGKQRFLRAFWRRRDPTLGTAANEMEEGFYRHIAEANRRFREGGAAQVPGWRTDRGRVFIRYGEPDDVLREPQTGADRPWEAWKYTKARALKFVFMDVTRLGNYTLIYSDDRLERNPGDWMDLLSRDALTEISNF